MAHSDGYSKEHAQLAWTSDTELTFCDGGDACVATIAKTIAVKRKGTCAG